MFKTVISLFVFAVAIAVLGVSNANATTFCVPTFHADCPNDGTNVAQASLETAMSTDATDGVADTVLIAGTTVIDPDTINPSGSDPLLVQGVGPATKVTSSTNQNAFVLNLASGGNGRQITLRDFTLVIPASMPDNAGAGAQVSGDTFDHVDIQSFNPGSDALPSWIGSGGVYRNGTISGAGAGSIGTAVRVGPGSGTVAIEDSFIDHPTGAALSNNGATGILTMRRSRVVSSGQTPVQASAGTTSVENSVVQTAGASGFYALASSSAAADINLDQVTAVNSGGNSTAIVAQATAGKSGQFGGQRPRLDPAGLRRRIPARGTGRLARRKRERRDRVLERAFHRYGDINRRRNRRGLDGQHRH